MHHPHDKCPPCPVCAQSICTFYYCASAADPASELKLLDGVAAQPNRPGDGTFCCHCGEPLRFRDDMQLRAIGPEELSLFLAHDESFRFLHRLLSPKRAKRAAVMA